MNTDASALMRNFLNDAYSVFTQRDLWLFVDSEPASEAARLGRASAQTAPPSELLDEPQGKTSRDLLGVLRSPASLGADAASKSDLAIALKALSASGVFNGLQAVQSGSHAIHAIAPLSHPEFMELSQQAAAKSAAHDGGQNLLNAASRQAPVPDANQAILTGVAQGLRTGADPGGTGEKLEYAERQLLSMMQNRALVVDLLVQIAANTGSASQSEGEFELPVILNAGMIPGAAAAKGALRPLGAASMNNEQILATLLQLGVEPGLLEKLKKILERFKGGKKLAKSFLSLFIALFIVAERMVEELSLLLEEGDDIKEKLAYADARGFTDDRRRVYI